MHIAIGVSIGAGLATGVGGSLVFFPAFFSKFPQTLVLGVSLALSAGVMLYVSFIEIFVKAHDSISSTDGISPGVASAITTVCFFGGMVVCVLLEMLVGYLSRRAGTSHEHFCPAADSTSTQTHSSCQHIAPKPLAGADYEQGCGDKDVCQGGHAPSDLVPRTPSEVPLEIEVLSVGLGEKPSASTDTSSVKSSGPQHEHHELVSEEDKTGCAIAARPSTILRPRPHAASTLFRLARMGLMTGIAIAIHNFPEGLATFLATVTGASP